MPPGPDASLRLPAARPYAAVVRSTTAALAARLDFTVDDLDDLRIAVGEVTTMLLEVARAGAELAADYHFGDREITVELAVGADSPAHPDREGFAWQLLAALTTSLAAEADADRLLIRMVLKSAPLE